MTQPIRIAAIGLGWVVTHRHVPAILRNPAYQLVGVADRHAGRAQEIAHKFGVPHFAQTNDLASIPWLDQVDALTIGTPPMAHAALACEAFARGKHVLTEKPFAMSVPEGESMVEAAQKANKTLGIVHNFQFSHTARKLDADLKAGKLGAIRRIAAVQLGNPRRRLPVWYESLPLGLFYDESPHFFYLLNKLSGGQLTLQQAHGVAGQKGENTPSLVHLLYRGQNNIPVTVDCQFDSAISEWHVMVTGEKAVAILDIFRDIYIRLPNDGAHGAFDILRTSLMAIGQHLLQHIPNGFDLIRGRLDYGNDEIFARFAQAVRSGNPPPSIGGAEALAVLRLQHEATAALQKSLRP